MIALRGKYCSCTLANNVVRAEGSYYRYVDHKRRKTTEPMAVQVSQVLRIGETKTYSRAMLAIPMIFGMLALFVWAIPILGIRLPVPSLYYVGIIFWRLPFQVEMFEVLGFLCLLTIPLYLLSYRKDLEINTTQGRFLLPQKGMKREDIDLFQRAFTAAKVNG